MLASGSDPSHLCSDRACTFVSSLHERFSFPTWIHMVFASSLQCEPVFIYYATKNECYLCSLTQDLEDFLRIRIPSADGYIECICNIPASWRGAIVNVTSRLVVMLSAQHHRYLRIVQHIDFLLFALPNLNDHSRATPARSMLTISTVSFSTINDKYESQDI